MDIRAKSLGLHGSGSVQLSSIHRTISMTIILGECRRHSVFCPVFSPFSQSSPTFLPLQIAIVITSSPPMRPHSTPEQFTAAVATYYEQKTSYNQQYNIWLTSQSTSSTLNLRPKDNMPAHEAEENAAGAAGSTSPLPDTSLKAADTGSAVFCKLEPCGRGSVGCSANSVPLHFRHLRPSRQGLQGLDRI
jgi:hypothetical protein